jgi:hypothetical protein
MFIPPQKCARQRCSCFDALWFPAHLSAGRKADTLALLAPLSLLSTWIRDSVTILGTCLVFVRPVECALRTKLIKLMKLLNAKKLAAESVPGEGIRVVHS